MEAIITTGALAPAVASKTFVAAKGVIVASGITSGLASFAITETLTGNVFIAVLVSAISSGVVAFFSSRPKYIAAISHAKLSEHELLGKQTADLIDNLKNTADENSRIATLQVFARHTIQGFYQASVSHIDLCHMVMEEHGLKVPSFTPGDVQAVLKELDDRVDQIKSGPKR